MIDLSLLPSPSKFTLESIETFIGGTQNCRTAKLFVAESYIRNLKAGLRGCASYSAYVMSELSKKKYYLVQVWFETNGIKDMSCVCKARSNTKTECKHKAALLFTLLALRDFGESNDYPPYSKRKCLRGVNNPKSILYQNMDPRRTWQDSIKLILGELQNEKSLEIVTEVPVAVSRKKLYCLCNQPFSTADKRPMIECDRKIVGSGCKQWYHFECVDKEVGSENQKNYQICLFYMRAFCKTFET